MLVREAQFAGSFYPADKEKLEIIVKGMIEKAKTQTIEGELRALIVPHAGYMYSGPIAATAYKLLQKQIISQSATSNSIILLGPSHQVYFDGASLDDKDLWETPLGKVECQRIEEIPPLRTLSKSHANEHCLEVQLPFLQYVYSSYHATYAMSHKPFAILPILTGEVDSRKLAFVLEDILAGQYDHNPPVHRSVTNPKTTQTPLLIVSSDLSHYHLYDQARKTDRGTTSAILNLDFDTMENKGEACGETAILTLMHIAKNNHWKIKLLDSRNSGDTAGDKSQVVGYASFAFYS